MTDQARVEPALSADEWAKGTPGVYGWDDGSVFIDWREHDEDSSVERPHAIIAALNAALPDSDPRKITRERVKALRREADWWAADARDFHAAAESRPNHDGLLARATALSDRAATLCALADALASYLPPEGT